MRLSDCRIDAVIAVNDLEKAREFYEAKLGLEPHGEVSEAGTTYACGEGTRLYVYPSPGRAGGHTATMAYWSVPDIDEMIEHLLENGVEMIHYDLPDLKTDERGVFTDGDLQIGWFCDPDGNTFAIESDATLAG
mgnify:FL=1